MPATFFFFTLRLPVPEPVDRGCFGAGGAARCVAAARLGAGGDVVGDAAGLRSLVGIILRTAQRTPRACVSRSPGRKEEPEGSGGTLRFLLALRRAGRSAAGRIKAKIHISGRGKRTVHVAHQATLRLQSYQSYIVTMNFVSLDPDESARFSSAFSQSTPN